MKRYFIIIMLLSVSFSAETTAQPFKFGKISKKDFDIEHYREKYPEDYAVTIGDWAFCKFVYKNFSESFHFEFERTCRIMVLDERGIDLGDIVIDYYSDKGLSEKITNFKVNVYNLEGGKIKKEKFSKKNVFTTDVSNNWYQMRYAAPNVRPGTVIEFTYLLRSDYLQHLRGWEFQKRHPVEYSFYELRQPAAFFYRNLSKGLIEVEEILENIQVNHTNGEARASGNSILFQWKAEEVPAFLPEPHTDNDNNYLTSIEFEYMGNQWSKLHGNFISATWKDVSKTLYGDEDFGEYLKQAYTEVFEKIPLDIEGEQLRPALNMALEAIREKVHFNDRSSVWAGTTPAQVLASGQGNSAEINLLLIALLQNKGIDARPVLLSTRQKGALISDKPTLTQFNYLLTAVKDSVQGIILLDAATKDLPAGYIPEQAVNGKGRMISKTDSEWVVLENPGYFHEKKLYNLTLNDDGSMSGDFRFSYYGYGKVVVDMVIGSAETGKVKEKLNELINESLIARVDNLQVEVPDSDSKPTIITGDVVFENYTSVSGDEIFLQPMLMETTTSHDFNLEERKYPVFFDQKTLTEIEINLKLPEGFVIEGLPEKFIKQFGNVLIYEYEASENEGKLKITDKTLVRAHMISAVYYNGLKDFFTSIVDKSRESIVLRKN